MTAVVRSIQLLFVTSAVACASQGQAPSPTDAHSAISAAQAVGAEREPKAALHLKLARDQTALAESKIRNGDNHEARLLLDQAKADAELSLILTREAAARAQAEQALQKVQQLEKAN